MTTQRIQENEANDTVTNALQSLHIDIDARVSAITATKADWPCRRGCDGCCHRLAQIPELTEAEWRLLQTGLKALAPDVRQKVYQKAATLSTQTPRKITCPMLDTTTGSCLVYAFRPVACRTYGFYVERDKGLYCSTIEALVNEGEFFHIVWGNHDTINRRIAKLGAPRLLVDWMKIDTSTNIRKEVD